MSFAASLAAEKPPTVRRPYPEGVAGVRMTLEKMAQLIREGSRSAKVQGWAMDQLMACGITGRDSRDTAFRKAKCLFDAVRKNTVYVADPPMTEMVKSAETMLCLRDELCIRGGDCDDVTSLTGAVVMSAGIPVKVIKQTFGPEDQEHVLLEAQEDDGTWFAMDPSSNFPCGEKAYARGGEFRLDPLNPSMIGLKGAPDGEFISIEGLPAWERLIGTGKCGTTCCGDHICSDCSKQGKKLARLPPRMIGAVAPTPLPAIVGSPSFYTQAATDLMNQVAAPIQAGDTYRSSADFKSAISSYKAAGQAGATGVGPEIDLVGAANVTQPATQQAWQLNVMLQRIPESSVPDNADLARNLVSQMLGYYVTAINLGQSALSQSGGSLSVPGSPRAMSLLSAMGYSILGSLAGVWAWEALKPKRRRRR